jgi:hypothetical protein
LNAFAAYKKHLLSFARPCACPRASLPTAGCLTFFFIEIVSVVVGPLTGLR